MWLRRSPGDCLNATCGPTPRFTPSSVEAPQPSAEGAGPTPDRPRSRGGPSPGRAGPPGQATAGRQAGPGMQAQSVDVDVGSGAGTR